VITNLFSGYQDSKRCLSYKTSTNIFGFPFISSLDQHMATLDWSWCWGYPYNL